MILYHKAGNKNKASQDAFKSFNANVLMIDSFPIEPVGYSAC